MTTEALDFSGTGQMRRSRVDDQVIYYRKPNGWITWGDSISGTKLMDYSQRGFEPLWKYGTINKATREGGSVWDVILRHPSGPTEFPIEQIVTYRWHRKPPLPAKFPQLRGKKIVEYSCPECSRAPFIELRDGDGSVLLPAIQHFGNHLRIMHRWDRLALLAYGDRVGIDFNAVDARTEIITEYEEDLPSGADADPDYNVEKVRGASPFECDCGWKPKGNIKNPRLALSAHKRLVGH